MAPTRTAAAITPATPVARVQYVQAKHGPRFARLGILTVRDLLYHLPRRWEDTSDVLSLAQLRPGPDVQTARATVRNVSLRVTNRKKVKIVEASLVDDGHVASAVWFNQPFLLKRLHSGMQVLLSGKVRSKLTGLE